MSSLYQAKRIVPFHVAVGAVVANDKGEILVHRRRKNLASSQFDDNFPDGRDEVFVLMRESLEDGETLEQGVLRGIKEEFGMTGKVDKFLGSLQTAIVTGKQPWGWQKTTLYFQVTPLTQDERTEDEESFSLLEWHEPEFLIERMRGQGGENRKDLDESEIIEAYVTYR